MRGMVARRFPFLVMLVAAWTGAPAAPLLPHLGAELAGKLELPKVGGMPPLAWRVGVRTAESGELALTLSTTAPGLSLEIDATLPVGDAAGTWRVRRGAVDLAAWWPVASSRLPAGGLPPDLELTGALELSGEGTWRGAVIAGTVSVSLASGSARSAAQNWEATELGFAGELSPGPEEIRLVRGQVRIGQVRVAGITARKIEVDAGGRVGGSLEVQRASVDVLGGRIGLSPFAVNLAEPKVETTAEFGGLALSELAALMPEALAEAQGQLSGRVAVRWSAAVGPELGSGSLAVLPGVPASMRLAQKPGFLTGRMPVRIAFLPAWLGPISRWLSVENPARQTLNDIELGQQSLAVDSLRVELYPDGPDGVRSASVEVSARPIGGGVVDRVTFTVNVAGPLTQVLRLGLNDRAKVSVAPKK
jgi:hypothetical protein